MEDRYEKDFFTMIVEKSTTLSDVCRNIGLTNGHGNRQTVKKYINLYCINTEHFRYVRDNYINFIKIDIIDILIENSTYGTTKLKERLYKEGYKERKCEICGQDEEWNGKKLSLILDHINGINNDNRIENLQIVCPNCNATLETHCSKTGSKYNYINQKNYCKCGKEICKGSELCLECYALSQRKVKRPDELTLLKEIKELGYTGTGRKYGVSDNTIRKWKSNY